MTKNDICDTMNKVLFHAQMLKKKGSDSMYSILSHLLADREGGVIFTCFGLAHWIYILLAVGAIALSVVLLRNRDAETRDRVTKYFGNAAFALYVADFFLMPFAYGEIDVEKLPFHACTAMCVMCFLSNHSKLLGKYRLNFALLGLISNLCYLVYPAGVMWYEIHPLSYRAVQTLLFHSAMVGYGVLTCVYHYRELRLRTSPKNLLVLAGMTVWAFWGNTFYSGEGGDYSHDFNWFFLKEDPFGLLPAEIAPYLLPAVNIIAFFGMELLVYFICHAAVSWERGRRVEGKNT